MQSLTMLFGIEKKMALTLVHELDIKNKEKRPENEILLASFLEL
jgi:hypothetical protein